MAQLTSHGALWQSGAWHTFAECGERILDRLRVTSVLTTAEYELARQQIVSLPLPAPAASPRHARHAMFNLSDVLADVPRDCAEPYWVVSKLNLQRQA